MTNELVVPRAAAALGVGPAVVQAVVHKTRIELLIPDQAVSEDQLGSLAASFKVRTSVIAYVRGPCTRITIRGNFL
jgi:hypothetical protein